MRCLTSLRSVANRRPQSFEALEPPVEVGLVPVDRLLGTDESDEVRPLRVLEDHADQSEVGLFRDLGVRIERWESRQVGPLYVHRRYLRLADLERIGLGFFPGRGLEHLLP